MEIKFKHWTGMLEKAQYGNGRIALRLIDVNSPYEPIAVCTVNIVADDTEQNEVVIKNYSENEGMYNTLLEQGVITKAHRYLSSGWVGGDGIPVCYLKAEL